MWRSIASRYSFINTSFRRRFLFCFQNPTSQVIHGHMYSSSNYRSLYSPGPHQPKRNPHQNQSKSMFNSNCNCDGNNSKNDAQTIGLSSNDQKLEPIEGVSGVDEEKLEKLLSLFVDHSVNSIVESHDNWDMLLNLKFFLRMIENPPEEISDGNFFGYFKWVFSRDDFKVPNLILSKIMHVFTSPTLGLGRLKQFLYLLWDMIKRIGAKESGVVTTEMLNDLLHGFAFFFDGKNSFQILDKFEEFGCVPNFSSYFLTAVNGTKYMEYPHDLRICQKIVDDGILQQTAVSKKNVSGLIRMYCQRHKPKLAHLIYVAAKEKTPQEAVHCLIRCLSKRDETLRLAVDMLADLSRKNATGVFTCVVSGLCRTEDLSGASKLIREMMDKGPYPGTKAFNEIIKFKCLAKDMDSAFELLESMEERGLKPNVGTYRVLVKTYDKYGKMEEACEVFSMAQNKYPNLDKAKWLN